MELDLKIGLFNQIEHLSAGCEETRDPDSDVQTEAKAHSLWQRGRSSFISFKTSG